MTKRFSEIQWQGKRGEKWFEVWATDVGLLPTKMDPDTGIDYVCQVVGKKTSKASYQMAAKHLAIWVRGSKKADVKVRLDRDDAQLMLQVDLPAILVIVDLKSTGKMPKFYVRPLDKLFAEELAGFLKGKKKTRTVKISTCIHDKNDVLERIRRLLKPTIRQRIAVVKNELRLRHIVDGAQLSIVGAAGGGFSVIRIPDFAGQFDLSAEESKTQIETAVFGLENHLGNRLAQVPLRKDVVEAIGELPQPVLIAGPLGMECGEVTVTAKDSEGSGSCLFQVRQYGIWTGYCHVAGLTLRMSKAVQQRGQWVHLTECVVDPAAEVADIFNSDLRPFLEHARGKAEIVFGKGLRLSAQHFPALNALGWLCRYLEHLFNVPFLDVSGWKAEKVSEEDLQSCRVLWELQRNRSAFDGFGFVIGGFSQGHLIHHPLWFELPLCMNLRGQGLICWLQIEGEYLLEPDDQECVGLRVLRTRSVRTERGSRSFPTDGIPKFKVYGDWPAISIHLLEQSSGRADRDDWGVEIQPLLNIQNQTQG